MRYRAEIVELPARPEPSLIEPGSDIGPSVPTCKCGMELAPEWAYCPGCSRSTSPPAPPPPSRAEQLDAEMARLRAARDAATRPLPPNVEQQLIGAMIAGGKKGVAEVGDLDQRHFGAPGLGWALVALRHLVAARAPLTALNVAVLAERLAEAAGKPGEGPRMPRRVDPTPSTSELERWSQSVEKAEAVQVARDLAGQVIAAGEARRAELEERERFWEETARRRAPEGSLPCPYCQSWMLVVEPVDGFRSRERCQRCGNAWPARPIEQPEET